VKGGDERVGHGLAVHVGRNEIEARNPRLDETLDLNLVGADVSILRKYDPAQVANLDEPLGVGGVLLEVLVVKMHLLACGAQGLSNDDPSQAAV
jgi:hypothetical protein